MTVLSHSGRSEGSRCSTHSFHVMLWIVFEKLIEYREPTMLFHKCRSPGRAWWSKQLNQRALADRVGEVSKRLDWRSDGSKFVSLSSGSRPNQFLSGPCVSRSNHRGSISSWVSLMCSHS